MKKSRVTKALLRVKRNNALKLAIPLFFILTIITLYYFEPGTFEDSWKGRAPYIIFLGVLIFELAIASKRISKKKFSIIRTTALIIATIVPILYILAFFSLGLKSNIVDLGETFGTYIGLDNRIGIIYFPGWVQYHWPLSLEYLILSTFFTFSVWLVYGFDGIKKTSIALFFLWATGTFYMIDTLYPYDAFAILQSLSPLTASLVVSILNMFKYDIRVRGILIYDPPPGQRFPNIAINWPCAGVHSLIIYTMVILLFMKNAKFRPLDLPVNVRRKIANPIRPIIPACLFRLLTLSYRFFKTKIILITIFVVGALGTFLVNILRIVSIMMIWIKYGSKWAILFHNYYGELYFIAWILIYPSLIIYGPRFVTYLAKKSLNWVNMTRVPRARR